ncbi:MAG: glucose/arabinose dehydrogenase [Pseudohongiellaceae bacterium]|jgi:glucose/arabinose dehydrogenase
MRETMTPAVSALAVSGASFALMSARLCKQIAELLLGLLLILGLSASVSAEEGSAPVALSLEVVASGLNIPVYATAPAGDASRVFVLELYSGMIRLAKNGVLQPTPFLDLSAVVLGSGERGLLGLVFHPNYENNRRFFVFYNGLDGATKLERYHGSPSNPDVAMPVGRLLLSMGQPFKEHNGGMMQFGTDGMLYISTGDGGGPLDPFNNAQDLSSLLGKILRLDVDSGNPYSVPADNPFVGLAGAREEIFAYGLRNPWRFSIDLPTGTLFIGDVGADTVEEVNVIPGGSAGQNFGWRCKEGSFCTGQSGCSCPAATFTDPLFDYFHSPGCAVIGGFVSRGQDLVGHQGRYFFTDYCDPRVFSFDGQNGVGAIDLQDHSQELLPPDGSPLAFVSSFGLDGSGELLLVSQLGSVYRVVPFADCDGDSLSDSAEIAGGTAFDANNDSVPDDCQLLLQGSPLAPGQTSFLWFIGAEPNQPVAYFVSLAGLGVGPCLFSGTLCLDLAPFSLGGNPRGVPLFGVLTADAEGAALLPLAVPANVAGLTSAAFQAVAVDGIYSVKSNPLVLPVGS